MNTWQKIGIGVGGAAALAGAVWFTIRQINKDVVTVQTAAVARQDLTSVVTASGEIKPMTYTNVLGEGIGKITEIVVKEGDHVKKGDRLLLQENIQASADVQAQAASINSAESGVEAAEASYKAAQSDLLLQQANLEKARLDWERGQGLFKDGLIPKQDFDQRKTGYDAAVAQVDSSKARVLSLKATLDQMRSQVMQGRAVLDVFLAELHFQPMHASLGGLHLHHAGAEPFELRKASFSLCQPVLQVEQFLFLHAEFLMRCGAAGVGLPGFLYIGGDRRVAVAIPLE